MKRDYPWIILEIACPFDGQASKWSRKYQDRYYRLMNEADITTHIGQKYTRSYMFRRNRYMVDNANLRLAAYDGQPGGTAMTVDYAENTGVPVQTISPLLQTFMEQPSNTEEIEQDSYLPGEEALARFSAYQDNFARNQITDKVT